MARPLSLTITFILIASIWAQDCNNPLLTAFNLDGLSAPQSGSGLKFCSNLQTGQTCCSAATVDSFQSLIEATTSQLQAIAGARDTYLVQLRNNYLSQFENLAGTLQSYNTDIDTITAENADLGANITNETSIFTGILNNLTSIDNDFNGALRDYQAARAACFENLLEVQASAWCLACDPNYATNGVLANGTIVFSNDLCNAVSSVCYPFLQGAAGFNPLIRVRESFDRLQNLTNYLSQFDSTQAIPSSTIEASSWNAQNSTELTVAIPEGCTGPDDCQWQCNNLFPGGVLNQTIAANGAGVVGGDDLAFGPLGVVAVDNSTNSANTTDAAAANATNATNSTNTTTRARRARRTTANGGSRLLQQDGQNTWSPNLGAAGVDISVARDPAGIFAVGTNADNLEEIVEAESTPEATVAEAPVVVVNNTTTTPNETNATVAAPAASTTPVVAPENTSGSSAPASGAAVANGSNSAAKVMAGLVCVVALVMTILF